jgi:predicted acylesterase/phospholipase RssA
MPGNNSGGAKEPIKSSGIHADSMILELWMRIMNMRMMLSLFLALLAAATASATDPIAAPPGHAPSSRPRSGVALIITGAAARIPQEAALLQALDERGLLKDLVFISGDSSGALNAILHGRMSWKRYRAILSGIRNADVYIQHEDKVPVDTSPFRALLSRVVEGEMGYTSIGELPIPTAITITRLSDMGLEKTALRMCSRKINAESDPSLSLVDILMASTAFPVVFPPVPIRNAVTLPNAEYVDGGAGEDYVPFKALLEFEQERGQGVERIYIISRKSDAVPEISQELRVLGVNDYGVFDKLGISLDSVASRRLARHLKAYAKQAPEAAARTFVWKPDFPGSFLLFSFDALELQYAATEAWAALNAPVSLDQYLAEHGPK